MNVPNLAGQPVIVTVNGVTIPAEAIAAEAQNHPAPRNKPGWAWRAAANALVIREVLLQEAQAQGISPDPAELEEGKYETDEESLIRQLLDSALPEPRIDEAVLRTLYDTTPDAFRGPSLFEAAHILFSAAPDDESARTRAREQAAAVLAELRQDPGRFAELAARYSVCPSRENGGLLGQLASGDTVPEFESALAGMDEGGISEPVESRYGVHLIRLDARVTGDVLPFSSVLPRLQEAEEKAHWVRESRRYIRTLCAGAEISGADLDETPWL